MTHDVTDQLRAYRDSVEAALAKLDEHDDAPLVDFGAARRRPRWHLLVAAAAVLVIVVGIGLGWAMLRDDPADVITDSRDSVPVDPVDSVPVDPVESVPVDPPVPPTTVRAPTPTTPNAAESVTWTKHEGVTPSGDGYVYNETPVGLVATHHEDFEVPRVLMSSNGFEWTEVPIPAAARVLTEYSHEFEVQPTPVGVWLTGPEDGLWFTDLESWASGDPSWEQGPSHADLLDLKGPPPLGTRWVSEISSKARIGNTSLLAVDWELAIDYQAILDLPPGYTDIQHDDLDACYSAGTPGEAAVRGHDSSGEEVCLTRITLVNEAGGLSVFDENGDQVLFIDNAAGAFDFGDGGPRVSLPTEALDLYASSDGQLELLPMPTQSACGHDLDQGVNTVVHRTDCPELARSTTDGVTWEPVPYEVPGALAGRHPLGFFWESTWPWGVGDDTGPPAILISEDGVSWTELVIGHGSVVEIQGGLVVTQLDEDGDLVDELVVYDGESTSTVQVDWPVGEPWPQFLGAIGNTLILIDGTDAWVGEVFED